MREQARKDWEEARKEARKESERRDAESKARIQKLREDSLKEAARLDVESQTRINSIRALTKLQITLLTSKVSQKEKRYIQTRDFKLINSN